MITAFGPDATEMTLAEAARRAGFSRPSARRILLTLQQLGYVRVVDRRFRLTPRILDLGYAFLSTLNLPAIAAPILEDLVARVPVRCNVSMLDGFDSICVSRVTSKGDRDGYPAVTIGKRFPANATSMGLVLLSGLGTGELDRFLENAPLAQLTPHTVTDPAALRTIVTATAARGWAYVDEQLSEGICSIAVPITGRGGIIAALSVGWFTRGAERNEDFRSLLLGELQQAAGEIGRALILGGNEE